MGKHFFEKRCHYSIRKFTIGAASVMIGASIFGTGMVQAAETEGPAETEGTVTQAQPLDKLPADIAAAIEKAEASAGTVDEQPAGSETGATAAETTTPKPTETPAPKEEVASKPATNPKEEAASEAKPAASPATKDVVDTPDVNHLEKASATASNHEANTQYTAEKAIDGKPDTRWATDQNVEKPTIEFTLEKTTVIKHVEIDWDRRVRGEQNDPNIKSWNLYYAGQDDVNGSGVKEWKLAYQRTGNPLLDEKIDLKEAIQAKYLKLEITDYQAGTMNWKNVGIQEIRAYSNIPDASKPTDIRQVTELAVAEDGKSLILPKLPGQVSLIGSNKQGVVDLNNKIYKPLTDQTVKVMVQQVKDTHTFTKEFEVLIKGLHADEGVGTKPAVAPAVQQWYGTEGKTSITADTVISVGDSGFGQEAKFYQTDLESRGLEIATGDQTAQKRIEFKKVEDKGYGKEGYGITVKDGVITVEAATNAGAFYATRTLLQMGENDLQNGEIRDFPSFSHRGFMLDTGRKFIPYDTLVDIMLNMAYYKMNDLQLHLNDNYIFLKDHLAGKNLSQDEELDYVLKKAKTGFRVETDVVGKNGEKLTSDEHYTKEEMQEIIKLAKALHINLVPEIDTPGHALSFVKVRPDLMYKGQLSARKHNVERVAMLDLDNKYEETLAFVKSVYDKLLDGEDAPLHGVSTVHIGTDEYYGNPESYRRYVNDMIQYIKGKGLTPRIWGSLSAKQGTTPVDWKDVEVDIWSIGWQRPAAAIAQGAKIINITDIPTYSVPSGSNSQGGYGDYANYETQYNRWTPNDFSTGGGPRLEASNPNILGGGHAVWNDNIDLHETGLTSYDIFKRFFKSMQSTAERTWGSDRAAKTYAERVQPASVYAPQSNPDKTVAEEDLFKINPETVKDYLAKKVQKTEAGLNFEKDSTIEGLVGDAGPSHVLKLDVTVTGDGEQTFSTSGNNQLYLADKDGYLAYTFEQFHIQFNKKLEKNKRYQISVVTKPQVTEVYVDGEKVERIANPANPRLAHNSLVLPLETIGGFKGILHSAELSNEAFVNPRLIPNDHFTVSATSQELPGTNAEGPVEKAFDNDPNTFWHSKWSGHQAPFTVAMNLKAAETVNGLTYLPRPGGGNGVVTSYEIYAQKDGQMVKVASGNWENNAKEKTVNFDAIETDKVEFKVLAGAAGFGSAAEIQLLKPVSTNKVEEPVSPEKPVTPDKPETPEKPVTPEKPKVEEMGDGTTELADSFVATKPTSDEAVAAAAQSQDYLKKEYKVFPTPQKVTYDEGVTKLHKQVNLVMGDQLDIYTRNRLKSVLQDHQISYTSSQTAVAGATNIYLGVHGQNSQAEKEVSGISQGLFDKIDAYALSIKNNTISIVGKDTDAVFYGLTTLKHMLNESEAPVLRNVTVEDFAEIKNRGFIEGYYGNPWSNADRAELMRYGGDLKLTQYFFAPKDDPYHNKKWRELYPEEKLAEIRELARVGNQNKTRYVWTIHPFMNNRIRFGNDADYQKDLETIKAKFTQLMDVGVREFGILADDAPSPVGGYNSYNRLMKDMTDWLTEKQATYVGLRKEMIFVPGQYWGNGREDELKSLNENLPTSTSMTLTGGKIWGEVSESFLSNLKNNLTAGGKTYRPVSLWVNWPVTDNSKQHLILGGGEKFLHPNVDPSLLSGIMLNPMQQSEPSKIALFSAAQYAWKQWKSEEEAKRVNDIAFNFVENGKFTDSETSLAFRELGKHMINQNMDGRVVKLEESVELAPKLDAFMSKLKAGQDVGAEREGLRAEFAKLKAAAQLYKASGDEKMRAQIHYWLDNTIDQMDALSALLDGTEAIEKNDSAKLWDSYYKGLKLYEQSQTYTFHYVDHDERAELGVQHIRPFLLGLREILATEVQKALHPDQVLSTFITNRTGVEGGLAEVTDGDLGTHALIKSPNSIQTGDYIGLKFNKAVPVQNLTFAMGTQANPRDTFNNAKVEYLNENDEWVTLSEPSYTGNEPLLKFENLNINAKAVRMIATSDRGNTWFAVREIAVNRPVEVTRAKQSATVTISPNLMYKYNTTVGQITDGRDNTEAMLANADRTDTTPVNGWVQLDLGEVKPVTKVRLVQGSGDKLAEGVLEYSADGSSWQELDRLTGEQTKEIETPISARYVRVRNTKNINLWWRIADFSVETRAGNSELTDTNVESLKSTPVYDSLGRYDLQIPSGTKLPAHSYLGMKLDRLHQAESIQALGTENPSLNLEYSPNAQEWYPADQVTDKSLVRYVRLVNKTDQEQAVTATSLLVQTKEVQPTTLDSTSMGIHQTYGRNDVRKIKNLDQLFDGVYNNFVEFSDYARKDGHITLKLGSERDIKKIRAYIQDGTQNYLRDGKIQVSQDGKTWTDVVTVGDGVANETRDDSLTDGWTHDSKMPGNRYIEGELSSPVKANYLRVLFTADYDARFVGFTELVINDGEFVKPINDPTVQGNSGESQGNLYTNLVDGKVLTSYKAEKEQGELVYHLSEPTDANHIRLVSSLPQGVKARVLARTLKEDKADAWSELGEITSSFQTFTVRDKSPLLDVKLVWEGGKPEFYEMTTFHQELPEEPEKPAPTTSKGDEPAPVVEVPEFTGGVHGVEAAVHEVPDYTGGVTGVEAAVHEVPDYTGGVTGVEAAVHEVPDYTGGVTGVEAAVHEVPDYTGGVKGVEAAVHEVPEFTGGVNGEAATVQEAGPEFTAGVNGAEGAIHEIPEYTDEQSLVALAMSQDKTYQAPASHPYKLPETGTKENAGLAAIGVVGALLGMFAMGKKKDDE
ncbi:SIALI-17 repeat-containing surface protein [Streptococcus sp. BJSWXB6CM1]|uniref:SIALI-17 repeat-containing surface protein n=1 Tax=Streptococcus sp. BJSWXB6CM1 TaxID=3095081 RepID=UPI002A7EAE24|nr:SIALI-17 repeat-containing surface protein [Streptococcus sp. BJSWXB6CM1]MDY4370493.1 SIALI-17 repeat-containing surface protein [Streptococcus sp. BJSWXB6CM1]